MNRKNQAERRAEALSLVRRAGYQDLTVFQERVLPFFFKKRDLLIDAEGQRGKTAAFILPMIVRSRLYGEGIKAVVLVPHANEAGKTYREFQKLNHGNGLTAVLLSEERNLKAEEELLGKDPNIVIGTPQRLITHIRRENCDFSGLDTLVVQALEEKPETGFFEDILFIASKLPRNRQSIILASHQWAKKWDPGLVVRHPVLLDLGAAKVGLGAEERGKSMQETGKVNEIQETTTNEESIKETISGILRKIKEEEDPDELNSLRRMVRSQVPISLRSYFSAYLFKRALGQLEKKPEAMTTLFISVGKNRKVYPRDLVSLFMRNMKLGRSDIGEIKVLDNYSFLDISLDHASEAISKLSGKTFRGKRITVNLARRKNDSKS